MPGTEAVQRMVKLSGKFDWVEHERLDGNVRYTYKSYREFASRDDVDGKIVRCRKDGFRAKFGNTPQHCYICNENINGLEVPDRLDRKWYVDVLECEGMVCVDVGRGWEHDDGTGKACH